MGRGGGGETTRSTTGGEKAAGVSNILQEVLGGATQSAVEWEISPLRSGVEELDQVHNSKRDFLFMSWSGLISSGVRKEV